MHPVDHARSTAHAAGLSPADWKAFVEPHDWMDATKAALANIRHRLLRHHVEGIEARVRRRGATLRAGGVELDVRDVLVRHLSEDVDTASMEVFPPRASDWVAHVAPEAPWNGIEIPSPSRLAERSAARHGGARADWEPFHAWMLEDMGCASLHGDGRHLVFRHHAWGCFDAEEEWGHLLNGVPVRVVAEDHIMQVMGRIPSAHEMLRRVAVRSWMSPHPRTVAAVKALGRDTKAG